MTIKQAKREIRIRVNGYIREGWELFSYCHKDWVLQSKEWKTLKKSKSKDIAIFKNTILMRLEKLENELYNNQMKVKKERQDALTAIKVITTDLERLGVKTYKTKDYDKLNNKELIQLLDNFCNLRNAFIN